MDQFKNGGSGTALEEVDLGSHCKLEDQGLSGATLEEGNLGSP